MATTFTLEIASGYAANTPHVIQVFQSGVLLGTATATASTVGKATFVSASVTLTGHSAGLVNVSSYDGNDTLTNSERYTIDAGGVVLDGDISVDAAIAAAQSTAANSKITTGVLLASSPMDSTGQLSGVIIISDDYLAAQDRAFIWTVTATTGVAFSVASCFFGIKNRTGDGFIVAGTVTEGTEPGTWDLTFDVLKTDTDSLVAGAYDWSVEVRDGSGNEITRIRSSRQVRLVAKQT